MSRIVSFRGQIADGGQATVTLHTNDGSTGYRIIKFECIPQAPGAGNTESITKIFKVEQTVIDALVDFADNRLLGVNYYTDGSTSDRTGRDTVIFDNEIFNQDIYITHSEITVSGSINYYIELEQMDLALDESTVATLKDIRNND
jgi:hypothetical protein